MLGYVSECEFKLQFEDSFKRFFKPLCFHAMSFVKDADIANKSNLSKIVYIMI